MSPVPQPPPICWWRNFPPAQWVHPNVERALQRKLRSFAPTNGLPAVVEQFGRVQSMDSLDFFLGRKKTNYGRFFLVEMEKNHVDEHASIENSLLGIHMGYSYGKTVTEIHARIAVKWVESQVNRNTLPTTPPKKTHTHTKKKHTHKSFHLW